MMSNIKIFNNNNTNNSTICSSCNKKNWFSRYYPYCVHCLKPLRKRIIRISTDRDYRNTSTASNRVIK